MKKITLILTLLGLVACSSTDPGGRFLATTAITVDTAMKGWAGYVVLHNLAETNQIGIRNAYVDYQAAMVLATNAYTLSRLAKDPSLFSAPSNRLFSSRSSLVNDVLTHTSTNAPH